MCKKEQIVEIAELIGSCDCDDCDNCLYSGWWNEDLGCFDYKIANELYNAGYRKQSEDTVEVVRCKDCIYFKQSVSALFPQTTAFICDFPYGLQKNVNENDFCCHGAK